MVQATEPVEGNLFVYEVAWDDGTYFSDDATWEDRVRELIPEYIELPSRFKRYV